jgi:NAD(P)H-hydrate epimerase
MRAVDEAASEPVDVLVHRAGGAVAWMAQRMLGGTYGRRVVVVAGKGNNGADGRDAAARLVRAGARVTVIGAAEAGDRLPPSDLVIDAAYGTGFRGEYHAPDPGDAPVLAVDIPSGVDGLTGEAAPGAVTAAVTVTFAALKPGLLFADGYERAGVVEVVDIGLDTSGARTHLMRGDDVVSLCPRRPRDAHKWQTAVWVLAGSAGMSGAANLCAVAAMRAGAGTVRLGTPGEEAPRVPLEVVARPVPAEDWAQAVLQDLERVKALAIGPGLGRRDDTASSVRDLIGAAPVAVVADADALWALGDEASAAEVVGRRNQPTVLTPHEGEFSRLAGAKPGPDRLGAARRLAAGVGATVLLKGSTTVVAEPTGDVVLSASGDARLATAGTGDVLTGIVAAFLAQGLRPLAAAAAAAYVHGAAAHLGHRRGLLAGDLSGHVAEVLSELW